MRAGDRDKKHPGNLDQRVLDVDPQPVSQEVILAIFGQVAKRQDDDRRPLREWRSRIFDPRRCRLIAAPFPGPHRSRDILQLLLAQIMANDLEAIANLTVNVIRDYDPTGLRHLLKSGGDETAA